jgi:hypothetical protein
MTPRRPTARNLDDQEVTIISRNPETLDGLQGYLHGAGFAVRCTRELVACGKLTSERTLAIILFPDDFRWETVVATLAELRPQTLPVLVTAHPQRFETLASNEVLIVPRPVWGWTILDALRARSEQRTRNDR